MDKTIPEATKTNFDHLKRVVICEAVALMRVYDKQEEKEATVVCGVFESNGEYEFIPYALMLEDNPYERFTPPTP